LILTGIIKRLEPKLREIIENEDEKSKIQVTPVGQFEPIKGEYLEF